MLNNTNNLYIKALKYLSSNYEANMNQWAKFSALSLNQDCSSTQAWYNGAAGGLTDCLFQKISLKFLAAPEEENQSLFSNRNTNSSKLPHVIPSLFLLLCGQSIWPLVCSVFASNATEECVMLYDRYFCRGRDRNILYICREENLDKDEKRNNPLP